MTEEIYNDYDSFAWVYNKHWENYSNTALPILEKILFHKLPGNARVLDLCCGAGQMVSALLKRKYEAVGLDGSTKLLEIAYEDVPGGEFIHADARSFKIQKNFDAVVSLFDSLNHIMTIDDMKNVFRSVFTHLKPGGYFVLDLNLELGFNERWKNGSSNIIEADHVVAVKTDYDSSQKVGRFEASIFKQEGDCWKRTDVKLFQKCYSNAEIINMLIGAGFEHVKSINTYKKFKIGMNGHPYFYGQKPEK